MVWLEKGNMKRLEIIRVEATGPQEMMKIIGLCLEINVPRSARLTVYTDSFNNELSIHIQWSARSASQAGKSWVGCELCRTVSDYGQVTHTTWLKEV
jgi:hypothetical protein